MIQARIKRMCSFLLAYVILCFFFSLPGYSQEKNSSDIDMIPRPVLETLNTKFPNAVISKWTKENEDSLIIYDIEFEKDGLKLETDIKVDGTIHNWEKQIELEEVPKPVKDAVEKKYPKYIPEEIMMITAIIDGKDVLEGYEIVLLTSDNKKVEVTVAPDGKILEDSGEDE